MNYLDILYKTYALKIKVRNEHRDNFHKWMTFYSVAIGAILVAYSQFHNGKFLPFLFIFFGLITSFLFHLSCKGYMRWNDHFIKLIHDFETEIGIELKKQYRANIIYNIEQFKVYTPQPLPFKVSFFKPLKSALISTPKVTLAFSFCTFIGWQILLIGQIFILINLLNIPSVQLFQNRQLMQVYVFLRETLNFSCTTFSQCFFLKLIFFACLTINALFTINVFFFMSLAHNLYSTPKRNNYTK